jgi:hypothetical protein
MSLARPLDAAAARERPLELYRDDGPFARALGAALGPRLELPPAVLVAAGVLPLLAVLISTGEDAPRGVVGLCIAWLVLAAGIASGRPHTDRLRWAVVPVLRLGEYAAVLWLGAVAGGSAPAAAFALLATVAFHHYDLVYRLRYQGVPPARRIRELGNGWDGRLLLGWLLLEAGWLTAGFYVMAGLLAFVFVSESAASWAQVGRTRDGGEYQDEEAEEE